MGVIGELCRKVGGHNDAGELELTVIDGTSWVFSGHYLFLYVWGKWVSPHMYDGGLGRTPQPATKTRYGRIASG